MNRDSLVSRLNKLPGIRYAEKNQQAILRSEVIPNDPDFGNQWNLHNTGQAGGTPGADINATQVWTITTGNSSVRLGVIDSGVEATHNAGCKSCAYLSCYH